MIKKNLNEQTYLEGSGAFLKSDFNIIQGTFFITSNRFVFCKRFAQFNAVAGTLLMHLAKCSQMVFEINILDIKSICCENHGFTSKFTITNSSNEEYVIQFISNKEKWLSSIQDALQNSNSKIKIRRIDDICSFPVAAEDDKSKNKKVMRH